MAITFHPWLPITTVLYPIFSPLRILHSALRSSLSLLLHALVGLGALYAVLHRTGVLKRLVRKFAEWQLHKNINGALFTIGDIEVDVLKGTAHLTDLIVHSPHRNEWQWDSPVIARAGKVTVTFNVLSTIDYVGPFLGFPAKDVYSVLAEDVIVFVEKRRNVFNFHLLDESLDLPDPKDVLESMQRGDGGSASASTSVVGAHSTPAASASASASRFGDGEGAAMPEEGVCSGGTGAGDAAPSEAISAEEGEEKANEIVTHVLGAVSTIGKAANEKGTEGLQTALMSQKEGFVSQLRQLQAKVGTTGPGGSGSNQKTALQKHSKSIEKMAKDSINVMKQMGKAVERSVSDMKENVDSFQKPPRKKEGWKRKNPDERFRFGCIVVRDIRIFSKDIIVMQKSSSTTGPALGSAVSESGVGGGPSEDLASHSSLSGKGRQANLTGWSKPILIKELALSSAELSPPIRARTEQGMPEFGLHIEKVLDITIKRLLAETAKTNSGRVLQTAFGEVFSWMGEVKRSDSQYVRG